MKWVKTHWKAALFVLFILLFAASSAIAQDFERRYAKRQSQVFYDRNGAMIGALPNSLGYFSRPIKNIPQTFKSALLEKEDRYFYSHMGFNPVSMLKRPTSGSSTLTQQLAKIILGNENKRNVPNKIFGPSDVTRIVDFSHTNRIPALGTHLNESTYTEIIETLKAYGFTNFRATFPNVFLRHLIPDFRMSPSLMCWVENSPRIISLLHKLKFRGKCIASLEVTIICNKGKGSLRA